MRRAGEAAEGAARRLVAAIDESYLAVQGPPGSGKSTVGARMIVDLVAGGRRVGVAANSHKVIGALLEKVARVAEERGVAVRIGQRAGQEPTFGDAVHMANNDAARRSLEEGVVDVVGGTTWLWSQEDMTGAVDVLFVDEAGQMSLADALAASLCARSVVLLGDPQQLDQPLQGTHPPGAERFVLAHVLDGEPVMPDHLGLFLEGSWRLHPDISAYTSEVFYEGRLHSHPGRDRLALAGVPPLSGTGIRFVPVPHNGQSSESPEEAAVVAELVRSLLDASPTHTDASGASMPLAEADVPPHHALQRAGAGPQRSAAGVSHRHGRQVPGPGGAHLHLLHGHQLFGGGAPWDGVPVQPQPAERGDEPGAVRRLGRRQSDAAQGALPHPAPDAPCERSGTAHGDGRQFSIN